MKSNRQWRTLMSVQLLNMVGDGLLLVGTPMLIASWGRANLHLPAFLAASSVIAVAALLGASVFLDSLSRRRTLMTIDACRITAALAVVAYLQMPTTVLAALAGVAVGLSVAVYRPALSAYIGGAVPQGGRRSANALRSLSSKVSSIAGPALAGLLISLHYDFILPIGAAALATMSFVAFYVGPTGDRTPGGEVEQNETGPDRLVAFRYVRSQHWILTIIMQGAVQIGFVSSPMLVIVPLWLAENFAGGQYGYVIAAESVGATLSALMLTRFGIGVPTWVAMPVLLLQGGVLLVVINGASTLWLYPAYFLLGIGMSVFGVLWISALQDQVPDALLGRVLAIDELGNTALATLGLVAAGVAVTAVSLVAISSIALAILVLSVVVAVFVPGVASLGFTAGERSPRHQRRLDRNGSNS